MNQNEAEVHILEDEEASRAYIVQMWAEIMEIYRQGNVSLQLGETMEKYLEGQQKDFMPEDTLAVKILNYLDACQEDMVCSLQLYHEALNHSKFEEPKQYEIRDINSIMNSYAVGWRRFTNPRYFSEPYGKQKGWERMSAVENTADTGDGLHESSETETEDADLPEEWLA